MSSSASGRASSAPASSTIGRGRCVITGLAIPELLRASHIKPWADCATDAERLDVFNGLLLAPHLDAAFDRGYITVADDGEVVVLPTMTSADRVLLGLDRPLRIERLTEGHRRYLAHHRDYEFKAGAHAGDTKRASKGEP